MQGVVGSPAVTELLCPCSDALANVGNELQLERGSPGVAFGPYMAYPTTLGPATPPSPTDGGQGCEGVRGREQCHCSGGVQGRIDSGSNGEESILNLAKG
jgi:hypothetical protein